MHRRCQFARNDIANHYVKMLKMKRCKNTQNEIARKKVCKKINERQNVKQLVKDKRNRT